jgi:hypothetical protein
MGLPALSRCPRAIVRRTPTAMELRFLGPNCDEALDVAWEQVGPDDDPEAVELRLLAQLAAIGYDVERLPPEVSP